MKWMEIPLIANFGMGISFNKIFKRNFGILKYDITVLMPIETAVAAFFD